MYSSRPHLFDPYPLKRISDILNVIDLELFRCARELALIAQTHNRDNE